MTQDVIDRLVGTSLSLRNRRPITKEQTQVSFDSLFENDAPSNFTKLERFTVALFVASLHQDEQARAFYADKLAALSPTHVTIIEHLITSALTDGPYGSYPDGPLSSENKAGLNWQIDEKSLEQLGEKLSRALEHAHFLTLHPRDANKNRLETLKLAGWDTPTIVTLSQIVAFLSYQLRIAHGLRVLAANPA